MARVNICYKLATILIILRRRRRRREKNIERRKTRRRLWISPLNVERFTHGAYSSTFLIARENDRHIFFKYIRMSPERFDHLLELVRPKIEKQYKVCAPIPAEERLAVTLRYIASGDSKQSISFQYKMGKSTINGIIDEVCDALWSALASYVKAPSTLNDWENIIKDFEEI